MKPNVVGLVTLSLLACKKSEKQAPPPPPPPPVAVDATAMTAAGDAAVTASIDAAPAPPPGGLSARADGVGPLDAKAKPSEAALAQLLPGYAIEQTSIDHGGGLAEEYVAVSRAGKLVLKIERDGDALTAIHIVGDEVTLPFGVKLGATYRDADKALGPLDCENAGDTTDWRANIVVCTSAKAPSYAFDFSLFEEEGLSAAELLARPDQLPDAKLVALTWQVP